MRDGVLRTSLLVLVAASISSCGAGPLDRNKAARLLDQSPTMLGASEVQMRRYGFEKGVAQGMWDPRGQVAPAQAALFKGANATVLHLARPFSRKVIEITGITDMAPNGPKQVEFRWGNSGLPEEARRVATAGGSGAAVLQLYDDGWRVVQIQLQNDPEPYALTPAERAADEAAFAKWVQARREERRRIDESRTPTRTIVTFDGMELTDTGFRQSSQLRAQQGAGSFGMWAGGFWWFAELYGEPSGRFVGRSPLEKTICISKKGFSSLATCLELPSAAERERVFAQVTQVLANWRLRFPDADQLVRRDAEVNKELEMARKW